MRPEEIWAIYGPKIKSYIIKHVPDKYEAEDILQEVAIRIQKNANKIKNITNVEAWLYRIAYNLIVDYYRGANKYLLIEDINEISVPAIPEYWNYNKETVECLLKLVEYLPEKYKEAIIESDYKGEKQSILGQKWGLSYSGSKTRIQRARKKLKAVLLSCCDVKSDNAGNIIDFHNKDNVRTKFSCGKC
jgi:RNA polymerase sigma-70 factor (ECF subfamily)